MLLFAICCYIIPRCTTRRTSGILRSGILVKVLRIVVVDGTTTYIRGTYKWCSRRGVGAMMSTSTTYARQSLVAVLLLYQVLVSYIPAPGVPPRWWSNPAAPPPRCSSSTTRRHQPLPVHRSTLRSNTRHSRPPPRAKEAWPFAQSLLGRPCDDGGGHGGKHRCHVPVVVGMVGGHCYCVALRSNP